MDSKCCLLLFLSLCSISASSCQLVDECGCRSETSGAAVNLTELDRHLVEKNESVLLNDSAQSQYYLQLCTPLQLSDNCSESSNTTVCRVSDVTYTSFGRADGVSYSVNVTNRSVVVMFSNGDSVGEASRMVNVTIFCESSNDTRTHLNSANDTFLDFTIYTDLQCVTITANATTSSTLSPSSTPMQNATTSITLSPSFTPMQTSSALSPSSTPMQNGTTSSTLSPSSTPMQNGTTSSTLSPSSTPMQNGTTSSTLSPSSTPMQNGTTSSTLSPSSTPIETSSTLSPSSTPMQNGTTSIVPTTSMNTSPTPLPATVSMLPSPVQPTQSPSPSPPVPSHFPISSTPSVLPSSSAVPCPSQPVCNCESCTKKLALSVGVAIPSTAIVAVVITLIFSACCQKARKGRKYIRLAPTVYFDEEDRD